MVWYGVGTCAWFELAVILFQVFGVAGLCLCRLLPSNRWGNRGRVWFVIALLGLGIAGALCGRHDSEFSLFAGGTMTALLIGMTMGDGQPDPIEPVRVRVVTEPEFVG
jgi:hypothetical protein